jgi:hypothetical protein
VITLMGWHCQRTDDNNRLQVLALEVGEHLLLEVIVPRFLQHITLREFS